jgi:septin family protein
LCVIPDKYLEVLDDQELEKLRNQIRRLIPKEKIEIFDEILVEFETKLQELTIQTNKKIVTPKLELA